MQVGITGASGFLGRAVTASLERDGHQVRRLVRRPATGPHQREWDGAHLAPEALAGLDAVVHLAGAGVADKRWSPAYKQVIRDSRVVGTRAVARAVAHARVPVLLSGSAIGYYGDRGDELLDEWSGPGEGFLADVCQEWEAATEPARAHARVVQLRAGIVMGREGGALGKQLLLFRLGLGAPLGSGQQWLSWVSLTDHVRALRHLLVSDVEGPVNVVAPQAVTNKEFTRTLGRVLHRPTLPVPVPRAVLRTVLGEVSSDLLASARVRPEALERDGFRFHHPDLVSGLESALHATPAG